MKRLQRLWDKNTLRVIGLMSGTPADDSAQNMPSITDAKHPVMMKKISL